MPSSPSLWQRIQQQWFLLGMITAVVLGGMFPAAGARGGALHSETTVNLGIALVFFLHGVNLPLEGLRRGVLAWRVHLVVQSLTYLLFPLLWLLFYAAFKPFMPHDLMLGFCYLAALPSTISSSVAMTAVARGDIPVAIFNATLSSLLGIVFTPLLISLLGDADAHGLSLGETMLNIAKMLLLPIVVGQLLRPFIGDWFVRVKPYTNNIDKLVILFIVYAAFCNSAQSGLWQQNGIGLVAITFAGDALFLGAVLWLSTVISRRLHFKREDEIAIVFCGSKKTLASGVPMAALIFGAI
ncbi:MAG TPA: bile acid:sodium symporter family protein, partial [Spongiibacteraceae bacterium]|nr:bile acid:sodium symporter family protein [Spongiibacteraceae bacterium]